MDHPNGVRFNGNGAGETHAPQQIGIQVLHQSHPRDWRDNRYVYAVFSRRSRGLSIGINLNPDKACNFDCIYCQVDRTVAPTVREVNLIALRGELENLVDQVVDGSFWRQPPFDAVPDSLRRLNDVAFSGDGEPTTYPQFAEAVELAGDVLDQRDLKQVKLIVITDACYLTRPNVQRGLAKLDAHGGEIWAKLDAGTEQYYREVNRPNYPLAHVMDNIIHAARQRPVVIQALWMRVRGIPPPEEEIAAFVQRLRDILSAGGRISRVQVYTVARKPAESYVAPLEDSEVDAIAEKVSRSTGLTVEPFHSAGS